MPIRAIPLALLASPGAARARRRAARVPRRRGMPGDGPPMSRCAAAGAFLLASALAGCGEPIAPASYPGDPRLVLHGQVISSAPLLATEAAVAWQLGPAPSVAELAVEARTGAPPLTGSAPTFTLELYDRPPWSAAAALREGEVALVRGSVVAFPYAYPDGDVGPELAAGTTGFGADVEHWIVHLDGAARAGTLTAWWLGAPLGAGYHLLRVVPFDPECSPGARQACLAELLGLGLSAADAAPYCDARYRLSPAPGEPITVRLGVHALPDPPACPPPP